MKKFYFLLITLFTFVSCSDKGNEQKIEVKKLDDNTTEVSPVEETRQNDSEPETEQITAGGEKSLITPREAKMHIGRELTVEGYVADVFKNDRVAYLNFDKKYPNNTFSGVIFASNFDNFADIYFYKKKNVRLTGMVSEYQGKPQIIIDDEDQLEIVK